MTFNPILLYSLGHFVVVIFCCLCAMTQQFVCTLQYKRYLKVANLVATSNQNRRYTLSAVEFDIRVQYTWLHCYNSGSG